MALPVKFDLHHLVHHRCADPPLLLLLQRPGGEGSCTGERPGTGRGRLEATEVLNLEPGGLRLVLQDLERLQGPAETSDPDLRQKHMIRIGPKTWSGLDWSGVDWTGLDWSGLD